MSSFISKTDYDANIRAERLDQVTGFDDTLLDKAEKKSVNFMSGYLNGRFDVDAIFGETGDDRDDLILGYAIDICMYYLWRLVNYRKVPDSVKEAYEEAKEWLIGVQAGEITPPGLPATTSETAGTILYGSNPKRENHV